jgi:hypothetical protein
LFRRVGEQYPLSYGLLYVHDDEHPAAQNNEFVVYRLAHGKATEFGVLRGRVRGGFGGRQGC